MQTIQAPPNPRPPRVVRAPFGWRIHPVALTLATLVTLFALVGGALLVLSIWFMILGIPLFVSALPALIVLRRHRRPGALRPASFVFVLGLVELGMAAVLLTLFGATAGNWFAVGAVAPGAITVLVAALLGAGTTEQAAPPPPRY